jgi:hypothetical protein
MAQYWLQTPVENAKEVVQRYIDAYQGGPFTLPATTVTYGPDCEVVLYGTDFASFSLDTSVIYFGTLYVTGTNGEAAANIQIKGSGSSLLIFDCGSSMINAGQYPYIIFNEVGAFSDPNAYFVGYKFNLI